MQKFYFQAVTKDGKKISGYIDSNSEEDAHLKLKNSGMSVLTLEKKKESRKEDKTTGKLFEFLGRNTDHKIVKGTIDAADVYAAYRKLTIEYKLELEYIMNVSLSAGQKEIIKTQGIPVELQKRLEKEKQEIKKKAEKNKKIDRGEVRKQDMERILKANEKKAEFIRSKIDEILAQIIPFLEENSDYIDTNKKREIEDKIDLLSRLKYSNSITHLQNLTKRLLSELSADAIFIDSENLPEDVQEEINRRKGQIKALSSKFGKAIFKGLASIDLSIGDINIVAVKKALSQVKPITRIKDLLFLTFSFISFLLILVLLFAMLSLLVGSKSAMAFIKSGMIWYILTLSLIMSGAFFVTSFIQSIKNSIQKKLYISGGVFIALLLFTIEFPVLFFWTN